MSGFTKNLPKLTKVLKKAGYFDNYKFDKILRESALFFKDINKLFLESCKYMQLDNAKYIYELSIIADIPIEINDEFIDNFEMLCSDLTLEYAKLMYDISNDMNSTIDICDNNDFIFKTACEYDEIETAKWLKSINDKKNYHLIIEDNKIKEWNV